MPGIAGIITRSDSFAAELHLQQMLDTMKHQPGLVTKKHINRELGMFVGWTCYGDDLAANMPVYNENKDLSLIFIGENFSGANTVRNLKTKGHVFHEGDLSYLVHLYEDEKSRFFECLNGFFVGMIADLRTQEISIFNDRYGMGRVYYHENENRFVFSTEAKSILSTGNGGKYLDEKGLSEYITMGCVLENRSLFRGIKIFPGASIWVINPLSKRISRKSYFSTTLWENQPLLGKEEFYSKLKETLSSTIPTYFRPEERIAMSLTGGLDTRIILSFHENREGELPLYTFGGMYRDSFDVRVSREIARLLKQKHTVIQVGNDFLNHFSSYAEKTIYVSDGGLDITGSSEIYVNRLAREIAPIRMTGNYGSEILRGLGFFKAGYDDSHDLFDMNMKKNMERSNDLYKELFPRHDVSEIVFQQIPWYAYARYSVEKSQLTVRTPYLDNALVKLMYQAPMETRNTNAISLRLISDGNPLLYGVISDRGFGGRNHPLSSIILRTYLEFLFKAEYYFNSGMPNWMESIDRVLRPLHLEKIFLGRHKFNHYRIWFRNELSDYVKEVCFDRRTMNRDYVNKKTLEKIVKRHMNGTGNYTYEINKIITIELINRLILGQ